MPPLSRTPNDTFEGAVMGHDIQVIGAAIVSPFEPLLLGLATTIAEDPQIRPHPLALSLDEVRASESAVDVLVCDFEAVNTPSDLLRGQWDRAVLLVGPGDQAWSIVEVASTLSSFKGLAIIEKGGSGERLREAIRLVSRGAFVCEMGSMSAASRRLSAFVRCPSGPPIETLSPREVEVLDLVASGLSNKEIGWQLSVSEGTVKAHVSHVMAKLRLTNRSQLVAYALATAVAASNGR
jgi:DNA-binding NarL/FixJ family response regulator